MCLAVIFIKSYSLWLWQFILFDTVRRQVIDRCGTYRKVFPERQKWWAFSILLDRSLNRWKRLVTTTTSNENTGLPLVFEELSTEQDHLGKFTQTWLIVPGLWESAERTCISTARRAGGYFRKKLPDGRRAAVVPQESAQDIGGGIKYSR